MPVYIISGPPIGLILTLLVGALVLWLVGRSLARWYDWSEKRRLTRWRASHEGREHEKLIQRLVGMTSEEKRAWVREQDAHR